MNIIQPKSTFQVCHTREANEIVWSPLVKITADRPFAYNVCVHPVMTWALQRRTGSAPLVSGFGDWDIYSLLLDIDAGPEPRSGWWRGRCASSPCAIYWPCQTFGGSDRCHDSANIPIIRGDSTLELLQLSAWAYDCCPPVWQCDGRRYILQGKLQQ